MSDVEERGRGLRDHSGRVVARWLSRANPSANLHILPALAYTVGVLFCYLVYGISLDYLPALVFLAATPALAFLGSSGRMSKYWVSIISIALSYEALQGAVGSLTAPSRISSLYLLDRAFWGFNLTGWVQSSFASPFVGALATALYSLHVPLLLTTALVVWFAKRALFGKYVTVMVITSYAALVTFIALPTSPPWYSGVATNLYQSGGAALLPQGFTSLLSLVEVDKFAAFPSLHAAYAIIFSYFMIKVDRRLAFVSIPVTVGILFSTLYLGQHYLIDLIGGAAYALIPCLIAEHYQINISSAKPAGEAEGAGAKRSP